MFSIFQGFPLVLGSLRNSHNKLEMLDLRNYQWQYIEGADYPYGEVLVQNR